MTTGRLARLLLLLVVLANNEDLLVPSQQSELRVIVENRLGGASLRWQACDGVAKFLQRPPRTIGPAPGNRSGEWLMSSADGSLGNRTGGELLANCTFSVSDTAGGLQLDTALPVVFSWNWGAAPALSFAATPDQTIHLQVVGSLLEPGNTPTVHFQVSRAGVGAPASAPDVASGHMAMGVQIFDWKPQPGAMDMLRGWDAVRLGGPVWDAVEKHKGEYNFSSFNGLFNEVGAAGLSSIVILSYNNHLYSPDESSFPNTTTTRKAFVDYAVAEVAKYSGRGILWEIWNEPFHDFDKQSPSAAEYTAFAIEVAVAIHHAHPMEQLSGVVVGSWYMDYYEGCFRNGLLKYVDAVSTHPYSSFAPEIRNQGLRQLRVLIEKYAPAGKQIPLISSENGYTTCDGASGTPPLGGFVSEDLQARYLPRVFLNHWLVGVHTSVWFQWKDASTDPTQAGGFFGLMRKTPTANMSMPFDPKPAHFAAQALLAAVAGCSLESAVAISSSTTPNSALRFDCNSCQVYAVWSTVASSHATILHTNITTQVGNASSCFQVSDFLGIASPRLACTDATGHIHVNASDGVVYLVEQPP